MCKDCSEPLSQLTPNTWNTYKIDLIDLTIARSASEDWGDGLEFTDKSAQIFGSYPIDRTLQLMKVMDIHKAKPPSSKEQSHQHNITDSPTNRNKRKLQP
tara:strand:- start:2164 stop:2463 length:300 start_codon:yes stop_codon:yes gene_type:complete